MSSWPEERKEFIRICQRSVLMGMQMSTGGNLSMKLKNDLFLIKPSGSSLYDLREDDLLVVHGSGKAMEGSGKPTKEINTHFAVYKVRPDVGGVVHYHSPYSTAYAVSGAKLPLLTVHAKRILGRLPVIPVDNEGSESLAWGVGNVFSDPTVNVALMAGHGLIAAGADLRQAQNLAELLEETARTGFIGRLLSEMPHGSR